MRNTTNEEFRVSGIILASGSGTRAGLSLPKQFVKLAGKPVIEHTILAFDRCGLFDEILVVVNEAFIDRTREICLAFPANTPIRIVKGGDTRQESSLRGILECDGSSHLLIHDGVRPLVSPELLRNIIHKLRQHDAIDVCIPSPDTVVVRSGSTISSIPDRASMALGQTPQAFRRDLILDAHRSAMEAGITNATDDCGLVLRLGIPVHIEEGERANMKITHLDDLYLVERLFQAARLHDNSGPDLESLSIESALIIGGTRGIGRSISTLLRLKGAQVLVTGRETIPGIDVSSYKSIEEFVSGLDQAGVRFDCLVYCPGLLIRKNIADYQEEEWDATYDTNVKGVFRLLKHTEQLLHIGGHFLIVGSSAYSRGRSGFSAYSSSKSALINLMQAASEEFPEYRFNVVSPQRAATYLRSVAFGSEYSETLLSPDDVALNVCEILNTTLTGMNFDIRIDAPLVAGD